MEKTKEIKREQQERYIEGLKRYSQRGIPIYIDGKECRAEDCERLFEVSEDGAFYMGIMWERTRASLGRYASTRCICADRRMQRRPSPGRSG